MRFAKANGVISSVGEFDQNSEQRYQVLVNGTLTGADENDLRRVDDHGEKPHSGSFVSDVATMCALAVAQPHRPRDRRRRERALF